MNKRNPFPRKFPLSRVLFNEPNAWPQKDLAHSNILNAIRQTNKTLSISRYCFHLNENGTITPLSRYHEWKLAILIAWGRKTFRLI